MSVYNNISDLYDEMHESKNYSAEVDFLINLFSKETNSILDVGCGTGSHALLLAKKGYRVLGIDPSEKMIDEANKKLSKHQKQSGNNLLLSYKTAYAHEILDKFDAIISMFNVVNHVLTIKDLINYFEGVSTSIERGGLFIFDCFNQLAMINDRPKVKVVNDREIVPNFDVFSSKLMLTEDKVYKYSLSHKIWSPAILLELMNMFNIRPVNIYNPNSDIENIVFLNDLKKPQIL